MKSSFNPGFRMNFLDCLIILVGLLLSSAISKYGWEYSIIFLFPFMAFFMFCNVFRIRRIPELIWSLIFIIATIIWHSIQTHFMYFISIISIALIVTVISEMRHPSYHGLLWQKINPQLPIWFSKNAKSAQL